MGFNNIIIILGRTINIKKKTTKKPTPTILPQVKLFVQIPTGLASLLEELSV